MVDNPEKVICNTCGKTITKKHGGIHCSCGKVYCCSSQCVPEYYCNEHSSKSQEISLCQFCENELMEEIEEENQRKIRAQDYYWGLW